MAGDLLDGPSSLQGQDNPGHDNPGHDNPANDIPAAAAANYTYRSIETQSFQIDADADAAHLAFAAEAGRMGIWELDLKSGVLRVSGRFKVNFGFDADWPLTWDDLEQAVHPDDRARRHAALQAAMAGEAEYDLEYRVRRRDGTIGWLQVRAQVARAADGSPLRLAGISFDITERRAAEMRLELSEESLRLAADAAEVGTWDLDLTTDVLTWSDRTKAMFGISPNVPCSMADFYAGLHPDDFDATSSAFASAIDPASRATYDVEYRTVGREDGVIRWVAAKGRGLFHDGVCRRAIGTAIDITARKRAAIRQSFLLDLMDRMRHASEPRAIVELAVGALGLHFAACRVGYGQVLPDGQTILLETCHVDGVRPLQGTFDVALFGVHRIDLHRRGQTVVVNDVTANPDDDQAIWVAIETRAFVSVPLVRDGRFRASLFVNHRHPHAWCPEDVALIEDVASRVWDALERARAEEALRQLNAALEEQVAQRTRQLDRTWRLAPVLMVVAGSDGTLLEVNPAWTQVLGWTPGETLGRGVMEFVAASDRSGGMAGMELLFASRPVIDYKLNLLTKSGESRCIVWTTVPEGGRLYGYGRDVTDQIVAEERLLQAQKMEAVGQLTGGLAHDFNNLLTGVTGGLELLQRRLNQGRFTDMQRYIDASQEAARRAAALTQRLLAFSRRQTLDPKPTDIGKLVLGMEEFVRRTVGPQLQIDVALESGLWTTLVDPHQLENALLNLCINARDAMPDGGQLTIAAANRDLDARAAAAIDLGPGHYLALSVTDTGTGMPAEIVRRAFDPFFTTKPLGSGTGLGLSMVHGFAHQSGGTVRIGSVVGEGTCVCIYLPRHAGTALAPETDAAAENAPRGGRNATVLVVDDEATVRMLVRDVLEDLGHTAMEAEDGAAALRILERGTPVDLLVTDVGLPGGLNGRQLADRARQTTPGLRILFITGYAETAFVGTGHLEPGMQVLTKPFVMETLAVRIKHMMA